jgi:hypothetical protein
MRIGQKTLEQAQKALDAGYKFVYVTKGGKFGNTAIQTGALEALAKKQIGQKWLNDTHGLWPTRKDWEIIRSGKYIQYYQMMNL